MAVTKLGGRLAVSGSLTIGGDAVLTRTAAGTITLTGAMLAGSIDASGGKLLAPNGTAAGGTTSISNGDIRLATQGGTPAIFSKLNGTVFYFLKDGNL